MIQFASRITLVVASLAFGGCSVSPDQPLSTPATQAGGVIVSMTLTSSAFAQGQPIPRKYTCQGSDVSIPLQWSDPPQDTQSFALIMNDPDAPAGDWVHWVLYNIPAAARMLNEGIPARAELPDGSHQGKDSWGRLGYGGPCPPSGTHRYFFKLYALDRKLDLPSGATKQQVEQAMRGHILAQVEWMGTYRKS